MRRVILFFSVIFFLCSINVFSQGKMKIIFDTDTNNEVDDQNALAYLLLNEATFDVVGVTINATKFGGDVHEHYKEAKRIITLCDKEDTPVYKGVNGKFDEILPNLGSKDHDGSSAVDFIIKQVKKHKKDLTILAVGKLTNVALAMVKDPSIIPHVNLVWLGTNYPNFREYNFINDIPAMNYISRSNAHFEVMPCRYNMESGTARVKVYKDKIVEKMKGLGPTVSTEIEGRHGGEFNNLGDYLSSLFNHIEYYHKPPSRSLFDMVAVAVLKNKDWAQKSEVTAFVFENERWNTVSLSHRKIILWEFFDAEEVMKDFYQTLESHTSPALK